MNRRVELASKKQVAKTDLRKSSQRSRIRNRLGGKEKTKMENELNPQHVKTGLIMILKNS